MKYPLQINNLFDHGKSYDRKKFQDSRCRRKPQLEPPESNTNAYEYLHKKKQQVVANKDEYITELFL